MAVERRGVEPLTGRVQSPSVNHCAPRSERAVWVASWQLLPADGPLAVFLRSVSDRHDGADRLEHRPDLFG